MCLMILQTSTGEIFLLVHCLYCIVFILMWISGQFLDMMGRRTISKSWRLEVSERIENMFLRKCLILLAFCISFSVSDLM